MFGATSFLIIAAAARPSLATPVISVGNYTLQPNQPNQTITLTVNGGDLVTGFKLDAVLGNGSTAGTEPVFQSVGLGTGTLWTAHPDTTVIGGPISGLPQDVQASITYNTSGETAAASGNLVILTIDTTGFNTNGQSFPLSLKSTEIGEDSQFIGSGGAAILANITNGSITIQAPEPGTMALLALAIPLLSRRHRATHARGTNYTAGS